MCLDVIWKNWFLPIWEEVLLDERKVVFYFMIQLLCFCIFKDNYFLTLWLYLCWVCSHIPGCYNLFWEILDVLLCYIEWKSKYVPACKACFLVHANA